MIFRRGAFALLLASAGCARLEAPLTDQAATPAPTAAPGWLPGGWVRSPLPPAIAFERAVIGTYHAADAALPLCEVARYDTSQAGRLAARVQADGLAWLTSRIAQALGETMVTAGAPERWAPAGRGEGTAWQVRGLAADGHLDRLAGRVGVARTASGRLVVVTVLDSADADRAAVESLWSAVPAEP